MKQRLVEMGRRHIAPELRGAIKHVAMSAISLRYRRQSQEIRRLSLLQAYVPGTTKLLGPKLDYTDACSAAYTFEYIFIDKVYDFTAKNEKRCTIIDCGANIGLSVIHFKRRHPAAKVVAFEADPETFKVLKGNVDRFKFKDVELHNEAVWTSVGTLNFAAEGSDMGHLVDIADMESSKTEQVKSIRLRNYLDQDIDLLKLDIEGAEADVLIDCADSLAKVQRIFIEFHSFAKKPQMLSKILSILENAGFRYWLGTEGGTCLSPFTQNWPETGMDSRINVFATRP